MKRFIKNFLIRAKYRHWREIVKTVELKRFGAYNSTRAPSPSYVQIELTTRCNLSCNYCALNDKAYRKEHTGELALEDVLKILPQTKGAKVLSLYGLGEPLLYKDLEIVIAEARKYVPQVTFTSNSMLLDEERSHSVADAGLSWIQVSLDSLDPEYNHRVRGGDVDTILNNLETFSKVTGLPVHIWSVVTLENIHGLIKFPELKEKIPTLEKLHFQMVQGAHLLDEHNLDGRIPAEVIQDFKEKVLQRCNALDIETDVGNLPEGPPRGYAKGVCAVPWTGTMYINKEGCVTPCCVLPEVSLDNVASLGLKEARNGPMMQRFRKELLRGDYLPSCSDTCGYYCNGKNSWTEQNQRSWTSESNLITDIEGYFQHK